MTNSSEYMRKYRIVNAKKATQQSQRWRAEHKEQYQKTAKLYRAKTRERHNEYKRVWIKKPSVKQKRLKNARKMRAEVSLWYAAAVLSAQTINRVKPSQWPIALVEAKQAMLRLRRLTGQIGVRT